MNLISDPNLKSGLPDKPHAVEPFSAYSFGLTKEYGVWRDATRRFKCRDAIRGTRDEKNNPLASGLQ
jgi:hypothetical protein